MGEETSFPLGDLPLELRINILRRLDSKSLLAACCVDKSWMQMISCISDVWFEACRDLRLLLSDDLRWRMSRDIYLRLAQRWRSITKLCSFTFRYIHGYYHDMVTAIYYHEGKIVTGFNGGAMCSWNCATSSWIWAKIFSHYPVTCIKFDDRILFAAHGNGVVTSQDVQTGDLIREYSGPCNYSRMVDYLPEANLVFSSGSRLVAWEMKSHLVAWEMTSGRLVLAEDIKELVVTQLLVAPFPGGEGSREVLVAARTEYDVVLWRATVGLGSFGDTVVSVKITNVIKVVCPNSRCAFPYGNQLHFDGRILYFVTHELYTCNGYLNEWDVGERRFVCANHFNSSVKNLIGVGKKYLLVIASTGRGEEEMNIVERSTLKPITGVQLCKELQYNALRPYLFCVGRRSWLDGFDGSNDEGEIFFYVFQPNCVNYFVWKDRQATGYRLPCDFKDRRSLKKPPMRPPPRRSIQRK